MSWSQMSWSQMALSQVSWSQMSLRGRRGHTHRDYHTHLAKPPHALSSGSCGTHQNHVHLPCKPNYRLSLFALFSFPLFFSFLLFLLFLPAFTHAQAYFSTAPLFSEQPQHPHLKGQPQGEEEERAQLRMGSEPGP